MISAGLRHRGCWILRPTNRQIGSLEGTTPDVSDDAESRENPVSKCGVAAQQSNYKFFAVSLGYCLSGSNEIRDYQDDASDLCEDGKGAYTYYAGGYYIMDVYEIYDTGSFSDSVIQIANPTDLADTATDSTEDTSGSGDANSGYKLTHSLIVIISALAIVFTVIAM